MKSSDRFALFIILLLCGCAETSRTVNTRTGDVKWKLQTNYTGLKIVDKGTKGFTLTCETMDNSTPTIAGGQAFALGMDAGGRLLTSAGLAFSTSGLGKVAASGVVTASAVANALTPQPTPAPRPAALQGKP